MEIVELVEHEIDPARDVPDLPQAVAAVHTDTVAVSFRKSGVPDARGRRIY
ncbi:hypothetical protein OG470_24675 [Micromonospora sp. NBC_00389]|uniref:hypothetical protein n=1 Tax=Micromonospora sp. NBC_00389 TaxID=2903586 RepID=UPI002E1D51F3